MTILNFFMIVLKRIPYVKPKLKLFRQSIFKFRSVIYDRDKTTKQKFKKLGFHGLIIYYLYNLTTCIVKFLNDNSANILGDCDLLWYKYNAFPTFCSQTKLTRKQLDTWYV